MTSDNNFDKILSDLRHHIGNLQDKNSIADKLITRTQNVNQTISMLKEYKEEVNSMNNCWRSNNRNNLVANLQAENRTIMSLQEENRQLKFSLEEMETALHLIMQKHRSLIVDFGRTEKILNLLQVMEKEPSSSNGKIDEAKFLEFLQIVEGCLRKAEDQFCIDAETIARYRTENATLRELLHIARANQTRSKPSTASNNIVPNGPAPSEAVEPIENGSSSTKADEAFDSAEEEIAVTPKKTIPDESIHTLKPEEMNGIVPIPKIIKEVKDLPEKLSDDETDHLENGHGENRTLKEELPQTIEE